MSPFGKRSLTVTNILIWKTQNELKLFRLRWVLERVNLRLFFGYFVISQWARVISSFSWEIKWLGVTITSVNRCEYFVILVFTDWFRFCLQWTYMINAILNQNPVARRKSTFIRPSTLMTIRFWPDCPMKSGIVSILCSV